MASVVNHDLLLVGEEFIYKAFYHGTLASHAPTGDAMSPVQIAALESLGFATLIAIGMLLYSLPRIVRHCSTWVPHLVDLCSIWLHWLAPLWSTWLQQSWHQLRQAWHDWRERAGYQKLTNPDLVTEVEVEVIISAATVESDATITTNPTSDNDDDSIRELSMYLPQTEDDIPLQALAPPSGSSHGPPKLPLGGQPKVSPGKSSKTPRSPLKSSRAPRADHSEETTSPHPHRMQINFAVDLQGSGGNLVAPPKEIFFVLTLKGVDLEMPLTPFVKVHRAVSVVSGPLVAPSAPGLCVAGEDESGTFFDPFVLYACNTVRARDVVGYSEKVNIFSNVEIVIRVPQELNPALEQSATSSFVFDRLMRALHVSLPVQLATKAPTGAADGKELLALTCNEFDHGSIACETIIPVCASPKRGSYAPPIVPSLPAVSVNPEAPSLAKSIAQVRMDSARRRQAERWTQLRLDSARWREDNETQMSLLSHRAEHSPSRSTAPRSSRSMQRCAEFAGSSPYFGKNPCMYPAQLPTNPTAPAMESSAPAATSLATLLGTKTNKAPREAM